VGIWGLISFVATTKSQLAPGSVGLAASVRLVEPTSAPSVVVAVSPSLAPKLPLSKPAIPDVVRWLASPDGPPASTPPIGSCVVSHAPPKSETTRATVIEVRRRILSVRRYHLSGAARSR